MVAFLKLMISLQIYSYELMDKESKEFLKELEEAENDF